MFLPEPWPTRRFDLIPAYLMALSFPANPDPLLRRIRASLNYDNSLPPNPHLIATLLHVYLASPSNRLWRQRMWYFTMAIRTVVLFPLLITFVFGCIALTAVKPPAFGLAAMFVVPAVVVGRYTIAAAAAGSGTRVTPTMALLLLACLTSLLFFNIAVVYNDPSPLSLFGTTAAFLTLNFVLVSPVVLAAVTRGPSLTVACRAPAESPLGQDGGP